MRAILIFVLCVCGAALSLGEPINWDKFRSLEFPRYPQGSTTPPPVSNHRIKLNSETTYRKTANINFPHHLRVLDFYSKELIPRRYKDSEDEPECRVVTPPKPPPAKNVTLWELLDEGQSLLELSDKYVEVVLLMGNTGSGKSTLTHLIAGDPSQMELVQNPDGVELIIDENGSIGQTTASQTVVPELVVDNTTTPHLAIYDSPGFDDNRGADIDITANFLLKAVTDHVTKVTLAFVVIHSSVSGTNDKTDFDRLVTHAINLVKDLEHYNPAIGLIVSKAPNVNSGNGKPLTDQQIQKTVISFIQMYRQDQVNQLNSLRTDRQTLLKKIEFVDILLSNNNDRIWHMRIAARCGLLSDDPAAMKTRKELRNLVTKNITIIPSKPEDFGWALTGKTLLKVNDYVEEINQNISNLSHDLVAKIKQVQNERMLQVLQFNESSAFIQDEAEAFSDLSKILTNDTVAKSPSLLAIAVKNTLVKRKYDLEFSSFFNRALDQLDTYLNFFDDMNPNPINRDSANWIKPFNSFQVDVQKRWEWYEYIQQLRNKLAEFSFQRTKPEKQVPTKPNMDFVETDLKIPVPSRIKDIFNTKGLLTDEDKSLLKVILDIAMERPKSFCNGDGKRMSIRGNYILVNEFTNSDGSYKFCSNPQYVEVLASQKFFIDQNIKPIYNLNQELSISAPEWEVTNSFHIDLNGEDGNNAETPALAQYLRASKGNDGQVGKSGTSGGSFYGISGSIINAKQLKVTASGGAGTDGTAAKDGSRGIQGDPTQYSLWPSCVFLEQHGINKFFDKNTPRTLYYWDVWQWGGPGGEGFPGGDGGVKGLGGYEGKIQIMQINTGVSHVNVTEELNKGSDGTDGKGGVGGEGGDTGSGLKARLSTNILDCGYSGLTTVEGSEWPARKGAKGKNGVDGGYTLGQIQPKLPTFSLNPEVFINDYKMFLISTQIVQFPNEFLTRLDESEQINTIYTPVGFAYELLQLEQYSLTIRNDVNRWDQPLLVSRYLNFLNRIQSFANKTSNMSKSDKKIFAILYTTALSQLSSITRELGSTIVVDVGGYLSSVKNRFDQYKGMQTQVVVDKQRESYAKGYEAKIEQALSFVEQAVSPGITQVEKELQATASELLDYIIVMQTAAENQEFVTKQAYEKMKEKMAFGYLFSALKVTSTLVGFLGPQGAAVGGLMGSLTNVGQEWVLGDYQQQRPPISLPPAIKGHADRVEKEAKQGSKEKMEELAELISVTRTAISENPDVLNDLSDGLNSLENLVKDMEKNRNIYEIGEYLDKLGDLTAEEKKLLDALDKKQSSLKDVVNSPNTSQAEKEKAKTGIDSITVVKNSATLINLGLDIFKQNKNNKAELERLAQMVRDAEKAVEDVKAYKESVENELIPMVSNIAADLKKVEESLGSQTSVSLAVTKWKVQSTLSDTKFQLREFTQGLPQQQKFSHCVDKLSEGMSIMIDLYDYMETYNEHMEFADYLGNIVSPDADLITITNEEAKKHINQIQLALQANILLVEYDRAIFSFKQWIFPFAHLYMDDFDLPDSLSNILDPASDINSVEDVTLFLIPILHKKIDKLDQRMKDYKALSFGEIDANLIKTQFNSSYQSSHPFFTWKQQDNVALINDLFSGKKIVLHSSPAFCAGKFKTAVKFRVAEFVPKISDDQKDELERVLNGFTVIMTHSGVSHYIYGNEPYSMVADGNNATLRYNFERDQNGDRLGRNMVYVKLQSGDFIMSPFTVWTVQFILANTKRATYSFLDLQRFAPFVDLELVGEGTYVDERVHYNRGVDLKTSNYYNSDNILPSKLPTSKLYSWESSQLQHLSHAHIQRHPHQAANFNRHSPKPSSRHHSHRELRHNFRHQHQHLISQHLRNPHHHTYSHQL